MVISLHDVQELLVRRPVLLAADPFVPICLPPTVTLLADGRDLLREIDAPQPHPIQSVALLADSTPGGSRFGPSVRVAPPTAAIINAGLPARMDYIRTAFLQQSAVAARITAATHMHGYETVVLMIVDGLSYSDAVGWPWPTMPCFVDGPSITVAGYPNVVGQPPLSRRLAEVGLRRAGGFSYWERSNQLTNALFAGVPLRRVNHFPALLEQLGQTSLRGTYVQIVREGLDRLAHHRREVTPSERQASVTELAHNCEALATLIQAQGLHGAIYLTADHGLLWKAEHLFTLLETTEHRHARYGRVPPAPPERATIWPLGGQLYYSYYYPYIGAAIRDNDAGVHGGCSYEESFVPFVEIEVTP